MGIYNKVAPYIRGFIVGFVCVVLLNSFNKVIVINIWPSVISAHGVME